MRSVPRPHDSMIPRPVPAGGLTAGADLLVLPTDGINKNDFDALKLRFSHALPGLHDLLGPPYNRIGHWTAGKLEGFGVMLRSLPEFERPPIDEVAIGVQFEPLMKLSTAHFGLYWSRIRERYPFAEDQPPLAPQIEAPTASPQLPMFAFRAGIPLPRCWFLDPTKNELVQVQRDRFLRNWRRINGDEPYPRFARLSAKFKDEWNGFLSFLAEQALGEARVNQCELTYVNQLEPGSGWNEYSDLTEVFTTLRAPSGDVLPPPELLSWQSRYKLPEEKGRLHVEVQPVFRARDLKAILSFTLTARGSPGKATAANILSWFDLAHEWIVKGFAQLTEPTMHEFWEKKQ